MTQKPKSIDEYLTTLNPEKRGALEKLRKVIRETAPEAEECISYGICAYKLKGMLVGFGATANHCAFYVMSSTLLDSYQEQLEDFQTSKGTIRFQPDHPLPVSLIKKLVKARVAENTQVRP